MSRSDGATRPAPEADVADLLLRVTAAGATPCERARSAAALPGAAGTRRRAERWAMAVAGTRDLDAPPVRAALATGVLGDPDPLVALADLDPGRLSELPRWAVELGELLDALPEHSVGDRGLRAPQRTMREAMETLLRRDLGRLAADRASVTVSDAAVADLAAQGAERVAAVTGPGLDFDLRFLSPVEIDGSRGDWCRRLDSMPVLGYLIGTAVRQWRSATREMLLRLDADLPRLRTGLLGGRAPGELVQVQGDAGDPHDDGRCVAILRFASGARVVYKPRDLRCAAAYFTLLAQIGDAFPGGAPHRRDVVLGEGYAWEEFVPAAECSDPARLPEYARRLGHLVRLGTFLHGRDLWQDNIKPHGDMPVLVDLETLAHPSFRSTGDPVADFLDGTVAPTGLVTAPVVLGPGMPVVDVGSCSPADRKCVPYRPGVPRLAAVGRDLDIVEDLLTWQPESMAWSGDRTLDPREYVEEVVDGYREAGAVLAARADRLLAEGGAAHAFTRTVVRVMWSGTWDAYTLLRAASAPQVLTDAGLREAVLARLFQATAGGPEQGARRLMTAAEIHDLRRLDVPLFRHVVGEDDILTSTGVRVPGLLAPGGGWSFPARLRRLAESSRAAARSGEAAAPAEAPRRGLPPGAGDAARRPGRADSLGAAPADAPDGPDADLAVLRSCQHLVDVHTGGRRTVPPHPVRRAAVGEAELVERAGRLLDLVWRRALRDASGRPGWLALHRDPALGVTVLGRAGPDLAEGLSGLLVATAELAAAGERDSWLPRTRELADLVAGHLAAGVTAPSAGEPDPLAGREGIVYALRRSALVTGLPLPSAVPAAPPAAGTRPAGTAGNRPGGAGPDPYRRGLRRDPARPGAPDLLTAAALAGLDSTRLLAESETAAVAAGAAGADRYRAEQQLGAVAAELSVRGDTVGYLPDRQAAPEHQLSVLDGLPAVVLALLRGAGRGYASVPLMQLPETHRPAQGPEWNARAKADPRPARPDR